MKNWPFYLNNLTLDHTHCGCDRFYNQGLNEHCIGGGWMGCACPTPSYIYILYIYILYPIAYSLYICIPIWFGSSWCGCTWCCGRPVCHSFPNLQSASQASQAENSNGEKKTKGFFENNNLELLNNWDHWHLSWRPNLYQLRYCFTEDNNLMGCQLVLTFLKHAKGRLLTTFCGQTIECNMNSDQWRGIRKVKFTWRESSGWGKPGWSAEWDLKYIYSIGIGIGIT